MRATTAAAEAGVSICSPLPMILWLLAEVPEPPASWFYPLFWPGLLTATALYIYLKARLVERYEGAVSWKRACWAPLVPALVYGLIIAWRLTDAFYLQAVRDNGRKMYWAHLLAPSLPALIAATIIFMEYANRRSREES